MLCDVCGKNQATVHLTEIVDEQMTELHLCEECAKQKSMQMEQQFGLSDLLGGLVDFGKQGEGQESAKVKCPNCNMTYEDFKKIGRLGCSNCYSAFIKYLLPLLKRIHGTAVHTGKVPSTITVGIPSVVVETPASRKAEVARPRNELSDLKNKLQEAVKSENFEEAAKLRDMIKELEKKSANTVKGEASGRESGKKKKEK